MFRLWDKAKGGWADESLCLQVHNDESFSVEKKRFIEEVGEERWVQLPASDFDLYLQIKWPGE